MSPRFPARSDPRCPAPGNPTPPRVPIVGDIVHVYRPQLEDGPVAAIVAAIRKDGALVLFALDVVLDERWPQLNAHFVTAKESPTGNPTPLCWNWPR